MNKIALLLLLAVFLVGVGCTNNGFEAGVSSFDQSAPRKCAGIISDFGDWRIANEEKMGQSLQIEDNVRTRIGVDINIRKEGSDYSGGTIESNSSNYSYGSYRANIKASGEPGTVTGFFTYAREGQNVSEIDVEIYGDDPTKVNFVSRVKVKSNGDVDPEWQDDFWFDLGRDASEEYIEYGFDWYQDKVVFSVNGEYAGEIDTNDYGNDVVPSEPGQLILNGWVQKESGGDYNERVQVQSVCYSPFELDNDFAMSCGGYYNPVMNFSRSIKYWFDDESDGFLDPRFHEDLVSVQPVFIENYGRYGEYKVKLKTDEEGDTNWNRIGIFGEPPNMYPVCSPLADQYNTSSIMMQIDTANSKLILSSNYYNEDDIKYNEVKLGFDPNDDYHVYGFDWHSDRIEYFVDNQIIYTETEVIPHYAGYFHIFGDASEGPWDNEVMEPDICEDGVVRSYTVESGAYDTNQYKDLLIDGVCYNPAEFVDYVYYDSEGNPLDIN